MLSMAALRSLHLKDSVFGAYYQRLVARGLKKGSALMAVMRKVLAVAAHLLRHEEEEYDPHNQELACRTLQNVALRRKGAIFFFRSEGFLAFLVQGLTNLMASLP
jgi:hypothetical protein